VVAYCWVVTSAAFSSAAQGDLKLAAAVMLAAVLLMSKQNN
jgi:hypothetical protein